MRLATMLYYVSSGFIIPGSGSLGVSQTLYGQAQFLEVKTCLIHHHGYRRGRVHLERDTEG